MATEPIGEPVSSSSAPSLRDGVDELLGGRVDLVSWSLHLVGERFRPLAQAHSASVGWSAGEAEWEVSAMRRALRDAHRQRWTSRDLRALEGAVQVVGHLTVYSLPVAGSGLPFGVCNVVLAAEPAPADLLALVDAVAGLGIELEAAIEAAGG